MFQIFKPKIFRPEFKTFTRTFVQTFVRTFAQRLLTSMPTVKHLVRCQGCAKYEGWVNSNQIYHTILLQKLTQHQITSLTNLFHTNVTLAQYILSKKFYNTLHLPYLTCPLHHLSRINSLLDVISATDLALLLSHIQNPHLITFQNYKDILRFIALKTAFESHSYPICWGTGNHTNSSTNVEEHYKKHVLDEEEGVHWRFVKSVADYQAFAVNNFYKMKDVYIHSHGKFVYLSGFHGNVFVVGRFDGDVFGISSCYYVETGRKEGREKGSCMVFAF